MKDEEMLVLIRDRLGGSTRIEKAMLEVGVAIREKCAAVCDDRAIEWTRKAKGETYYAIEARACASAIRARFGVEP